MSPQTATLTELLEPVGRCLSMEGAKRLTELRATAAVQAHVEKLAAKSTEGTLSSDELAEYECLVSAGTFIAVLQAQARVLLNEDQLS